MGTQSAYEKRIADAVGRVVAVESFYYDGLTDYSTKVWNPETGEIVNGPGFMDNCPMSVDGPAWVVAFYQIAQRIEADARRAKAHAEKVAYEAEQEAKTVRKGKTVKVVRGRKVPKGTMAKVFWVGETRWGWSVGLELPEGREFTALSNVEVAA